MNTAQTFDETHPQELGRPEETPDVSLPAFSPDPAVAQRPQALRRAKKQRPPKLYRIGEIVEYSGVSRQTIHNYTTMGLLHESRWTPGGHRLFDESVFERLDRIADLKAANKSLQEIRDHLAHLDG